MKTPNFLLPMPADLGPSGSRCISINVPDDPEWYSCFWGWFEEMTFAKRWNTLVKVDALAVADRWQLIYDEARDRFIQGFCGDSSPSAGCFLCDFTLLPYSFQPGPGDCASFYVGEVGWESCVWVDGFERLVVERSFLPVATQITSYEVGFDVGATTQFELTVEFFLGGSSVYTDHQTLIAPISPGTFGNSVDAQADEIRITFARNTPATGLMVLKTLNLCYVGAFPLSTAPDTFEHVFDFTVNDGGWEIVNAGVYSSGVGWVNSNLVFAGTCYNGVHIHRLHGSASLTSVSLEYTKVPGTYDDGGVRDTLVDYPGGVAALLSRSANASGKVPDWVGFSAFSDNLEFSSTCDVNFSGTCYNNGSIVLTKAVVRGLGPDPF